MRARPALVLASLTLLATACASTSSPATPGTSASGWSTTRPTSPTSAPVSPSTPPPERAVIPDGFELVGATVTTADGSVCDLCLWLAADAEQRARGLMFATELGPADGMAFVYDTPRTGVFWMKDTLLPLSIAFFDSAGAYMDQFDMEPCSTDPCPRYATPSDFLIAIETVQGGLHELGVAAGSVLHLTDLPCPTPGTD